MTGSSSNVFISYRHLEPDSTLAQTFADALREAGCKVFIDTSIQWGANWVKSIPEALGRADYFLLLLSREAANSEMVQEEISIALNLSKQRDGSPVILPVRLNLPYSDPLPYHISPALRVIQQESWEADSDTKILLNKLLETIKHEAPWGTESPASPPGGVQSTDKPQPQFDPRDMINPGGAVGTDSSFYIRRDEDEDVLFNINAPRALVTVLGPRQVGKTSLIMRTYAKVRRATEPSRSVFIDFQALPNEAFLSLNSIWRTIATRIADQLQLDDRRDAHWQSGSNYDHNFSRFLDHFVFKNKNTPLLLCLDEVDRVFRADIRSEFFSVTRAFYNRGAIDTTWKKVRWILGTSTEPRFFFDDISQSPFNIATQVALKPFNRLQVNIFARRHGLRLEAAMLNRIIVRNGTGS